jgi:7-carboxy-7-deazaguanine synthase
MKSATTLKITEIFYSLQGETKTAGLPTTFVRLTGCPLRCGYCDTAYAFHGGKSMSIDAIIEAIRAYPTSYVTVTGGEPLAQPNCKILLQKLCDLGLNVSLETSGALPIHDVDIRVSRVVDIKTPGSGEVAKNLIANYEALTTHDQVKFVICDRNDYLWAKDYLNQHPKLLGCPCFFSPCHPTLSLTDLANWIVEDRLQIRLQVQLHKIIWGDVPGK